MIKLFKVAVLYTAFNSEGLKLVQIGQNLQLSDQNKDLLFEGYFNLYSCLFSISLLWLDLDIRVALLSLIECVNDRILHLRYHLLDEIIKDSRIDNILSVSQPRLSLLFSYQSYKAFLHGLLDVTHLHHVIIPSITHDYHDDKLGPGRVFPMLIVKVVYDRLPELHYTVVWTAKLGGDPRAQERE